MAKKSAKVIEKVGLNEEIKIEIRRTMKPEEIESRYQAHLAKIRGGVK